MRRIPFLSAESLATCISLCEYISELLAHVAGGHNSCLSPHSNIQAVKIADATLLQCLIDDPSCNKVLPFSYLDSMWLTLSSRPYLSKQPVDGFKLGSKSCGLQNAVEGPMTRLIFYAYPSSQSYMCIYSLPANQSKHVHCTHQY